MKKLIIVLLTVINLFSQDTQYEKVLFDDRIDESVYKFNLMGHNENFILFGGHSSTTLTEKHYVNGVHDASQDYDRMDNEAQFQISIKTHLYNNFLSSGGNLFTAYTQNSYWQLYDTERSSPFRETNYMPELFLEWHPDMSIGDSTLKRARVALIHQSNGQNIGQSRSWNRTEVHFLFQNQNLMYGINMWERWNESDKEEVNTAIGDDNQNLEDYIGKQKYFIKYNYNNLSATLTHQNNIFHYNKNKGNTKLDITVPSTNKSFDFFVRYFNGYGESLIDYDTKVRRVSFGIIISDWI